VSKTPILFKVFFTCVGILALWNIIWLCGAYYTAKCKKSTSSRLYDKTLNRQFMLAEPSCYSDVDYINNPVLWPETIVGKKYVVNLNISETKFVAMTYAENGQMYSKSLNIGENIFYIAKDVFAYYESDCGLGLMTPGVVYNSTVCRIYVRDESLSIIAEECNTGVGFFILPRIHKRVYRRILVGSK